MSSCKKVAIFTPLSEEISLNSIHKLKEAAATGKYPSNQRDGDMSFIHDYDSKGLLHLW